MTTQNLLTAFPAAAALDFGADNVVLDALAAGAVAWCAPVVDASPCPSAIMIHFSIKVCHTAPTAGGTIEFYLSRGDDHASEIRDHGYLGTLTDHGTSTTAADIARLRLNGPAKTVPIDATIDIVYTGSFIVDEPGTDWNLIIYNGTGQTLNATANQSCVHWRAVTPDIQAAA